MRKLTTSTFCAILFLVTVLTQSSSAQVFVNGGVLDLDGLFGIGSNTSYFVIDFGGSPEATPGPRDSYAFGYQYDDPNTTVADALQGLVADGSGLDFNFGGTPDQGFGLFINSISFGADSDAPDFNLASRFWQFFNGELASGNVLWTGSQVGISSLPLTDEGLPVAPLTDGSFSGFRAQQFDSGFPRVPLVAIPEPSAVMLLGFASMVGCVRRRRA